MSSSHHSLSFSGPKYTQVQTDANMTRHPRSLSNEGSAPKNVMLHSCDKRTWNTKASGETFRSSPNRIKFSREAFETAMLKMHSSQHKVKITMGKLQKKKKSSHVNLCLNHPPIHRKIATVSILHFTTISNVLKMIGCKTSGDDGWCLLYVIRLFSSGWDIKLT